VALCNFLLYTGCYKMGPLIQGLMEQMLLLFILFVVRIKRILGIGARQTNPFGPPSAGEGELHLLGAQ